MPMLNEAFVVLFARNICIWDRPGWGNPGSTGGRNDASHDGL